MGILHRRLRDYLNRDIIVVMADGRAFKGILTEFDETAVVLKEVLETSSADVKWKLPLVPMPGSRFDRGPEHESALEIGPGEKHMARLKEVVLATSGILRVWLWSSEEHGLKETDRTTIKKV